MKHKPHPRCEHCGGALYRSKDPGWRPKKGDPYIYCRNADCQSNEVEKTVNRSKLRARRYGATRPPKAEPSPSTQVEDAPGPETQPQSASSVDLEGLRQKVCDVVDVARKGKPQYAVALALAIAADRVGEREVAAVLAVKHDLGRFGFKVA